VLMVFAFLPGAGAAPVASSPNAALSWAYGGVRTIPVHPERTADGWQYEGSVSLGYSVIINQSNDTAGPSTVGLAVTLAEGIWISLEFCRPNCAAPVVYANLSMHSWAREHAWANFTLAGTVYENGTAVPALALMNANSTVKANLTESTFSLLPPTGTGQVVDRSKYLSAQVLSENSVAFSPALGLVPLNLNSLNPSSATWNASSTFAANGSVRDTYFYAFHGPILGNITYGPVTGVGTYQPTGNVSVVGSFASPSSVPLGTIGSFAAIHLGVNGPFMMEDGIIPLPAAADFFGALAHPWAADQASGAVSQLAALEITPEFAGHLGLLASSRAYDLTSANPEDLTGPSGGNASSIQTSQDPAVMNPVTSTTLQGEPLAVPAAESNSNCLVTSTGCPATLSAPRVLLATVGIAVVVLGAAAVIAAVVIIDRRRLPPPAYPNARLYPPGTTRAPATGPNPAPEPPAEEDPLDHLW
jgi:hypothetical protein